jgi:hypothetical protein
MNNLDSILAPGWHVYGDDKKLQIPFDVAVVMPTIGRESILEAVKSIYAQTNVARIQLLIGVDTPGGDFIRLQELLDAAPPHVTPCLFYPGYSTSVRHGGLHPARDGGSLRTTLSYMANARYIAYLDDDNWWAPAHLRLMLHAINGRDWAFALRWFVHPDSRQPVCIDDWESVGPGRGDFVQKFGGWVDPNCLMIDKLACEPVLRWWSIPLPGDPVAMSADRHIYHWLQKKSAPGETNQASVYYAMQPEDDIHSYRLQHMGSRYAAVSSPVRQDDPRMTAITTNAKNQPSAERPILIALYLPQFHPIPENDVWWGKGFTEWTNVAKAKPLFNGHYQPHVPADLGYYDLRLPETRKAQADLARQYGIGAFCYYHYWFAGRRILERPFNEVLASGEPDFPFCLCWANSTWSGIWHGAPDAVLIEQTYPGDDDATRHFYALLPAFQDPRYLRVNDKPMFVIFMPSELPDSKHFTELWQKLAIENGLPGIHFVGFTWDWKWDHQADGFDAALAQHSIPLLQPDMKTSPADPTFYRYSDVASHCVPSEPSNRNLYPCVLPNWDNTPRSGSNGMVFHESTPEIFRTQLRQAFAWSQSNSSDEKIIFVKAWNEWAEGNYLEPDLRFGHGYLQVIKEELDAG